MRVCCYIRPCQTGTRYAGIGRYVQDVLHALVTTHPEVHWLFLHDSRYPHHHISAGGGAGHAVVDLVGIEFEEASLEAETVALELMLRALQPDWVLIPHLFDEFADRLIAAAKQTEIPLALIHYDLVPLVYPHEYLQSVAYRTYYMERLQWLHAFDLIASISEFSRQDLDRLSPGLPAKSITMGTASRPDLFFPAPSSRADANHYILCAPSGFDHRKNVGCLLNAYAQLDPRIRADHPLFLVGAMHESKQRKLTLELTELGIASDVHLLGFVDDADLIELYRGARLFVFPSLYEGFGLPVLEAILCGCVALAADRSALPEVIGAAEALFDPEDISGCSALIERALTDASFREVLAETQMAHAKTLQWETVAGALMKGLIDSVPGLRDQSVGRISSVLKDQAATLRQTIQGAHDARWLAATVADLDRQIKPVRTRAVIDQLTGWQIEGHLEGTYSLAQLNRESALGLHALGEQVRIAGHDGSQPVPILQARFVDTPALQELAACAPLAEPYVQSRNVYPPMVSDCQAAVAMMHHYAWEETGFPLLWAADFSQYLDGMSCLSTIVMKTLIDHGVDIPMQVSGCGVREPEINEGSSVGRLETDPFCFLHVSSCFPRKGADVLLAAYAAAFSAEDAVILKIKTFANPHNDIADQLDQMRARYPDMAPVELVFETYSEAQMAALYASADVLVAPSRAEGFGLPIAEAALCGLPAIVTGWGGPLDFCDASSAWLIDYEFVKATSHLPVYDSVWAEPSVTHLQTLLEQVSVLPAATLKARADRLAEHVRTHCQWRDVMHRHRMLLDEIKASTRVRPRIGWITTFGERCGIATTTEMLISHMKAPAPVVFSRKDVGVPIRMDHRDLRSITVFPSWDEFGFYGVLDAVSHYGLDVIVVQFVYPFYNYDALGDLISTLRARGVVVVLELHESEPPRYSPERHLNNLRDTIASCDRILVHSVDALNDLKAVGFTKQVSLFPLGVKAPPTAQVALPSDPWIQQIQELADSDTAIIASYGFFLPHKGLLELVSVFNLLRQQGRDIHLLLLNAEYPSPISRQAIQEVEKRIRALDLQGSVTLVTEFLEDTVSLQALQLCDLLVFPYRTTEQGASGAVRFGLASGRPVITTNLPIFDEFEDRIQRFDSDRLDEMAFDLGGFIDAVLVEAPEIKEQLVRAKRWMEYHHYAVLARRYYGMLTGLVRQRQKDGE